MEAGLSPAAGPNPQPFVDLGVTHRETLGTGVELLIAPRHVISWSEFLQAAPGFSIALDGYVVGPPHYSPDGPHLNLNHHEQVDRLGTRSTTGQVHVNLKQGLMSAFELAGFPCMHIFANDPDQDVSTAVWLLKHHERVTRNGEPLINRLVQAEDLLDTTAGAYPFDPRSDLARELNWIYDPYTQSRLSGKLIAATGAEMAAVIAAVGSRISEYVVGRGQQLPLDLRLERLGGGPGWALIREVGAAARTELYQAGERAFVAAAEAGEGKFKYSIGKMSPFIPFPIAELYEVLNKAEGIPDGEKDCWGGGDIIGGSPRRSHSRLSPPEIEKIINGYLEFLRHQTLPVMH